MLDEVATVLTVYGIETAYSSISSFFFSASLQQYLPFTVLKLEIRLENSTFANSSLQQYLPFTVLKRVTL